MKSNSLNLKNLFRALTFGILISVVSACGGGGGTTPPPTTQGSSNWDAMTWDQDNWG